VEQLEARCLLSASPSAGLYGAGWSASYLTAGEAAHAAPPSISAQSTLSSTAPPLAATAANTYDWIVTFNTAALAGINSAAQTASLLAGAGVQFQVLEGLGRAGEVLVRSCGAAAATVSADLASDRSIASFEMDALRQFTASVPNDPLFAQQWALENTGRSGGTPGDDIDAAAAWNLTTGSHNVVVAVIDTGVDYTDADLAANIWTNPYAGTDGYSGDLHGYDFVDNNGNPMDGNGHGTHVAGIIAAAGNNGVGVTGVDWSCSIMALKFMDADGQGYTSDAIRAINYMTMMRTVYDVNVRVANLSWDGGGNDPALSAAIATAGQAGILFVTAAGNDGTNNDVTPQYPANDRLANVISVAASDQNDHLAAFSDYGPTTVDLAAPGVSIYSTLPGNHYGYLSGTSMAAPEVSGVAALAWALDPNATVAQVRSAILAGVDPVPALAGKVVSGGTLNAYNTLKLLEPTPTPTPTITALTANPGSIATGGTVALLAQGVSETGGTIAGVYFYQDTDGSTQWQSSDRLIGSTGTITAGQASVTLNTAGMTPGSYQLFARAEDASGRWTAAVAATLTITARAQNGVTPATAVAAAVGSTVQGAITSPSSAEFFKFQAVAGGSYVFQTALGTLHDSVLTLFAADGQTVLAQNDDIAPGNLASRIAWQAPAAGTYYLAVAAYPGSGIGSYSLQLSAIGSPPAATVSPPVLTAVANQTLPQGGSLLVGLSGRDPGGNPLSYTAQALTPAGTVALSVSGNLLSIRPAASFTGRFQVQFSASDGLATTTGSFWVTVAAPVSQAAAFMPDQAESVDGAMAHGACSNSPPANPGFDLRGLELLYATWGER
jgi:subtilisin family serine protease